MENFQVFEVVWRYATTVIFFVILLYVTSYVGINKLRNKKATKRSIFVNEAHIILRSIIIVFVSFIFAKYMLLVEIGAMDYFKNNPNHNYTDFFKYAFEQAQTVE